MNSREHSDTISIEKRAAKELAELPGDIQEKVVAAIQQLKVQPLLGELLQAEFRSIRKLRVGTYRVMYRYLPREALIRIECIGHRRDVYRRRR